MGAADYKNMRELFDDPDDKDPKAQIWVLVGKSTRGKSWFAGWLIRAVGRILT